MFSFKQLFFCGYAWIHESSIFLLLIASFQTSQLLQPHPYHDSFFFLLLYVLTSYNIKGCGRTDSGTDAVCYFTKIASFIRFLGIIDDQRWWLSIGTTIFVIIGKDDISSLTIDNSLDLKIKIILLLLNPFEKSTHFYLRCTTSDSTSSKLYR
jgi:hypothetical protein